ncbi:MAG: sulfite oxidase [Desulfosporosinus sp.]|nr:sulfite oxidase [Desulfosporosinus sp.]
MNDTMKILSEKPLNAETPATHLQSWITSNALFFKRNQGQIMPVVIEDWRISIQGLVKRPLTLRYSDILSLPKVEMPVTLECSGNGRSLLTEKASGNPWTIGGVGNAVWGGVRLADVLAMAEVEDKAMHAAFEGLDQPVGSAGVKFIRSIPLVKALDSTILAFEMNGEPLPLEHGYPLRALALGWTGANCVKWLNKITILDKPFAGFFMDKVYRVFQKGEDSTSGQVVTIIPLKSIITSPETGTTFSKGDHMVRGAAYGGEEDITDVEVSLDDGGTWHAATFVGPHERYAWRRWEYLWHVSKPGHYVIMARAWDSRGRVQPMSANWNFLGYGNNGVLEHAVSILVR